MENHAYRAKQLSNCYKNGLGDNINTIRQIIGVPKEGFASEQASFIWKYNLLKPAATNNEINLDWYLQSLKRENDLNATILRLVSLNLFYKYEQYLKESKWVTAIEQLILYPKSSKLIHFPEMFSFIESIDEFTGEPRLLIDPSIETQQKDFRDQKFNKNLKAARRKIAIEAVLRQSKFYQAVAKSRNVGKKTATDILVFPQDVPPSLATMRHVSQLANILEEIDANKYKKIIEELDNTHLKLGDLVNEKERELDKTRENFEKRIENGELTKSDAEERFLTLHLALEDDWGKEAQEFAKSVIKKAENILLRLQENTLRQLKRKVTNIPQRKR